MKSRDSPIDSMKVGAGETAIQMGLESNSKLTPNSCIFPLETLEATKICYVYPIDHQLSPSAL